MSVQMTKTMRHSIQRSLDVLFNRLKEFTPCPVKPDQIADFYHAMRPVDEVAAMKLLYDRGYNTALGIQTDRISLRVGVDGRSYVLRLRPGAQTMLVPLKGQERELSPYDLQAGLPAGVELFTFTEWMKAAANIEAAVTEALQTFKETAGLTKLHDWSPERAGVEGWIGTAGQLVRMLPELATYLKGEHRQMLSEQRRSSTMPHEWHTYDRGKINRLSFLIAKAGIMPESEQRAYTRDNETWTVHAVKPA